MARRRLVLATALLAGALPLVGCGWGGDQGESSRVTALIPRPSLTTLDPTRRLAFDAGVEVDLGEADALARSAAARFLRAVEEETGISTRHALEPTDPPTGRSAVFLRIEVPPGQIDGPGLPVPPALEQYRLEIGDDGIVVSAPSSAGAQYALETLRQLIAQESDGEQARLPLGTIRDQPRFSYRGMHLDVGRHFFGVEDVKTYLDLMARYKLNRFHWHLTEDQGWRIEIERYPRLTEIGSRRAETILEKNFDPFIGDGVPHGGFYTQDEIREVVAYAAERHIVVIPEIEMPGHSQAALAAYPELACTEGPFEVSTRWGVHEEIYCPGEATFELLEGVLTEVLELFPSPLVHIGGDEAPKTRWRESALAQEVIRREGLAGEDELQSWFVRRIETFLRERGRRLIGWDEILEGGLAPDATVMSWRGMEGGIQAARLGHDVVMTPKSHCYFDYYQGPSENEPLAIGGDLPLETVYSFEPVPPELDENQARHVLGAQGNLWTEYIKTWDHVEYMVLPRMLALAEVVWSPAASRDFDHFLLRAREHERQLVGRGHRVRPDRRRFGPMRYLDLLAWEMKLALRSLRRNWRASLFVVAILGVALGGNTTAFSFLHANLLRPLPYPEADRLMLLAQGNGTRADARARPVSAANYLDLAERLGELGPLAAMRGDDLPELSGDRPESLSAPAVTPSLFELFAASPLIGRLFDDDDMAPGAAPVAVLAADYWRERFGGRSSVIGERIRLGHESFEIVGVLRPGFETVAANAKVYTALSRDRLGSDRQVGQGSVYAVLRIPRSLPLEVASDRAAAAASQLAQEHPVVNRNLTLTLHPLRDAFAPTPLRGRLFLLLQASLAFVVLMACANVASLQLARGYGQLGQLAIQQALGQGPKRLAAQLAFELLVLTAFAGVLGLGLAAIGIRRLALLQPGGLYTPRLDGAVLATAVLLTLLATLVATALPAVALARASSDRRFDVAHMRPRSERSRPRMLIGLVAAQIAAAVSLLAMALILIDGVRTLRHTDSGYDGSHVLTFMTWLPDAATRPASRASTAGCSSSWRPFRESSRRRRRVITPGTWHSSGFPTHPGPRRQPTRRRHRGPSSSPRRIGTSTPSESTSEAAALRRARSARH